MRSCCVRIFWRLCPWRKNEHAIIDSTPPGKFLAVFSCKKRMRCSVGKRYFYMTARGMYTWSSPISWNWSRSECGMPIRISAKINEAECSDAGLFRAFQFSGFSLRSACSFFRNSWPLTLNICSSSLADPRGCFTMCSNHRRTHHRLPIHWGISRRSWDHEAHLHLWLCLNCLAQFDQTFELIAVKCWRKIRARIRGWFQRRNCNHGSLSRSLFPLQKSLVSLLRSR